MTLRLFIAFFVLFCVNSMNILDAALNRRSVTRQLRFSGCPAGFNPYLYQQATVNNAALVQTQAALTLPVPVVSSVKVPDLADGKFGTPFQLKRDGDNRSLIASMMVGSYTYLGAVLNSLEDKTSLPKRTATSVRFTEPATQGTSTNNSLVSRQTMTLQPVISAKNVAFDLSVGSSETCRLEFQGFNNHNAVGIFFGALNSREQDIFVRHLQDVMNQNKDKHFIFNKADLQQFRESLRADKSSLVSSQSATTSSVLIVRDSDDEEKDDSIVPYVPSPFSLTSAVSEQQVVIKKTQNPSMIATVGAIIGTGMSFLCQSQVVTKPLGALCSSAAEAFEGTGRLLERVYNSDARQQHKKLERDRLLKKIHEKEQYIKEKKAALEVEIERFKVEQQSEKDNYKKVQEKQPKGEKKSLVQSSMKVTYSDNIFYLRGVISKAEEAIQAMSAECDQLTADLEIEAIATVESEVAVSSSSSAVPTIKKRPALKRSPRVRLFEKDADSKLEKSDSERGFEAALDALESAGNSSSSSSAAVKIYSEKYKLTPNQLVYQTLEEKKCAFLAMNALELKLFLGRNPINNAGDLLERKGELEAFKDLLNESGTLTARQDMHAKLTSTIDLMLEIVTVHETVHESAEDYDHTEVCRSLEVKINELQECAPEVFALLEATTTDEQRRMACVDTIKLIRAPGHDNLRAAIGHDACDTSILACKTLLPSRVIFSNKSGINIGLEQFKEEFIFSMGYKRAGEFEGWLAMRLDCRDTQGIHSAAALKTAQGNKKIKELISALDLIRRKKQAANFSSSAALSREERDLEMMITRVQALDRSAMTEYHYALLMHNEDRGTVVETLNYLAIITAAKLMRRNLSSKKLSNSK